MKLAYLLITLLGSASALSKSDLKEVQLEIEQYILSKTRSLKVASCAGQLGKR
jgi:hypothetical protein